MPISSNLFIYFLFIYDIYVGESSTVQCTLDIRKQADDSIAQPYTRFVMWTATAEAHQQRKKISSKLDRRKVSLGS